MFCQEGTPRNKEDVRATVKQQLRLACLGVASHVDEKQTDTGIKESYAQFWIQKILADAERLKNEVRDQNPRKLVRDIRMDVSRDLLKWVEERSDELVNPFLLMPGAYFAMSRWSAC